MNILVLIVVCVQIIVECLPISSSGHAIIFKRFFSLGEHNQMLETLETASLLPTLVVFAIFFFPAWWWGFKRLPLLGYNQNLLGIWQRAYKTYLTSYMLFIISSTALTCLLYIVIRGFFKTTITSVFPVIFPLGLAVTALELFLLAFARQQSSGAKLTMKNGLLLGLLQGIALLPGISRFATTYTLSRFLGFPPRRAFQVCFAISIPLFIPGMIKDLVIALRQGYLLQMLSWQLLLVIVIASSISYAALRCCYSLACDHKLWWFAPYMLVPLAISLLQDSPFS